MNKKGIAVMAILVGVLWSLASTNSVKAVSVTANQGVSWVQSKVGQAIDYDGVYGAQCVDLIKAYYAYLGVGAVSGNGKDYATNALPAGWSRVQGGSPQPGDILVYGGNNANTYGHVAIYESSTVTYHQNYNNVQRVQKVTNIKYNGFSNPYWGYIRPNWSGGGNIPTGMYDAAVSESGGTVRVVGWAYDADYPRKALEIHAYINDTCIGVGIADKYKPNFFPTGIGDYHGFDFTLDTGGITGEQNVRLYAIGVDHNGKNNDKNLPLGELKVTIKNKTNSTPTATPTVTPTDIPIESPTATPTIAPTLTSEKTAVDDNNITKDILVRKNQKITTTKIKTYKAKKLKKKSISFKLKAKTSGNGKLIYSTKKTAKKLRKYIKVSKSGKVTLKKKAKKGTYKILITASKTSKYKKATKVVKIKVK